ncbi:hypothetical protein [Corynebacterium pseudotuberculosis]|uniref:hypothetical protein n=1 Tax=Corynebacterium pseudotuberculosis TaxID=1719 RepID=UPI002FF4AD4C
MMCLMAITVRTSYRALAQSKATITCVLFVILMAGLLGVLFLAHHNAAGTMRMLYAASAIAPAVGVVIALGSLGAVFAQRRRPILRISDNIQITHSGASFPVKDLAHIRIWSDTKASFLTMLPTNALQQRRNENLYTVEFPQGAIPRPYEIADELGLRNPGAVVDKVGLLPPWGNEVRNPPRN